MLELPYTTEIHAERTANHTKRRLESRVPVEASSARLSVHEEMFGEFRLESSRTSPSRRWATSRCCLTRIGDASNAVRDRGRHPASVPSAPRPCHTSDRHRVHLGDRGPSGKYISFTSRHPVNGWIRSYPRKAEAMSVDEAAAEGTAAVVPGTWQGNGGSKSNSRFPIVKRTD